MISQKYNGKWNQEFIMQPWIPPTGRCWSFSTSSSVEVTSSHKVPSPAHDEADSTRWRSCTENFARNSFWIMSAILLRKLSAVYTLHSSLELGSLRYSIVSVKKRLPVGLASWHCCSAAPASSLVHVCGVTICEFTLNNVHYSTLIIFTAVW